MKMKSSENIADNVRKLESAKSSTTVLSEILQYADYALFMNMSEMQRKKFRSALKQYILNDRAIAQKIIEGSLVLQVVEHIGVGCVVPSMANTELFHGQDNPVEGSVTTNQQKFAHPTIVFEVQIFEAKHTTIDGDGNTVAITAAHTSKYNRHDFVNQMADHYIRENLTALTKKGKLEVKKNNKVIVMPPTNMWHFDNSHTTENVVLFKKAVDQPTYFGPNDTIQAVHSVPQQLAGEQDGKKVLAIYLDCVEAVNA